jgi:hypothetical protein
MRLVLLVAPHLDLHVQPPPPPPPRAALTLVLDARRFSNEASGIDVPSPEASAPPATPPPSTKAKMEEVIVKKAVDVAIANPEATKKIAVAAVAGASSDI